MKLSLAARLALTCLAIVLVGMALIGPLAWLAMENLYLGSQSASLLAQAKLIASALGSQAPGGTPVPYSQSSNTLPGIHTRVIDAQGGVVIDLAGPPSAAGLALPSLAQDPASPLTPEELLARPEIAQARQGQAATAVRNVPAAAGQPVLYAAAPVLAADGSVTQIVYLATPLPDTRLSALPEALRWQFAGVLLAALLLAGAAGWLLARRLARPLARLARAAQAVAGGDLTQSVPEDPAITELAALGRSFNGMTGSLRQSDQAKTAFISDVTHELRTPLTVIKGTIETLEDGALEDPQASQRFLSAMDRETERLIRLVNDLLVLTRADAGALNLRLQPLDLGELARSRCQQLAPSAARRQVHLEVSAPPTCLLPGDPDRLAQVLDNLLANALRYSPPGGTLRVSIAREGSQVVCRVADEGPGIPAEALPFIFERFYRVDSGRSREQGGSGLGLAIVRSLVLAHGGRVSAASLEGQGTTITFWLPGID